MTPPRSTYGFAALQSLGRDGEREHDGKRSVFQSESAIAPIPTCGPIIVGVNRHRVAANIFGAPQAAMRGAKRKSAAEFSTVRILLHGNATEPEYRYVVTRQST